MNEQKFQNELIKNYEKAALLGVDCARFLQTIKTRSAVATAHDLIRREIASDGFDKLVAKGQAALTMEAVVVKNEYADIFNDDEVNYCFSLLCDNGFFG